jgi:hypothetical protein
MNQKMSANDTLWNIMIADNDQAETEFSRYSNVSRGFSRKGGRENSNKSANVTKEPGRRRGINQFLFLGVF